MNNELLPVESIQERDVDLILLEELSTDIIFYEWLINYISFYFFLDGSRIIT